jgi:hypothetical protein
MLDELTVTSDWAGLADAIVDRYEGLADRVVCYFATTTWARDPADLARWGAVTADVHAAAAPG